MTRIANRTARLTMASSIALLTAMPALGASRADRPVQGWTTTKGLDIPALPDRARDTPASDMAVGDRPYCAEDREIRHTLQQDFAEKPVDASHEDAELWGSEQMGTWTLVAPREDKTSCIIASGIGYHPAKDVEIYYRTAGLD